MPYSRTLDGTTHTIPIKRETGWSSWVTNHLIDLNFVLNGEFQNVTASGGSTTIDFSAGRNVDLTLNSSTTLSFLNARTGMPMIFTIYQSGAYSISWPSTVKWAGGVAPDLSGGTGIYIVTLLYLSRRSVYVGEYGNARYT